MLLPLESDHIRPTPVIRDSGPEVLPPRASQAASGSCLGTGDGDERFCSSPIPFDQALDTAEVDEVNAFRQRSHVPIVQHRLRQNVNIKNSRQSPSRLHPSNAE